MRLSLPLLALCITYSEALNALFYVNTLAKTHLDFTDSLINSLVERGHTVDLIVARINERVKGNGNSRAARIYTFGFTDGNRWGSRSHLSNPFDGAVFPVTGFRQFTIVGSELCEMALADEELFRFISERNYDIGISSSFDFCGVGILAMSGIPSVTTFNAMPMLPIQPITYGLPNSQTIPLFHTYDLKTLSGRFWNFVCWTYLSNIQIPQLKEEQTRLFRKRYGKHFHLNDVVNKVDLAFVNSNELMEKPRAINQKIKYIGGINLKTPKPIGNHLEQLLSQRNGTVIFSFGTQIAAKDFPRYAVRNFVKVFRKLSDYTFLWKYEVAEGDGEMFREAENVVPMEWLPQTDLLYDPRVVAFISHLGLNSFNEASYAGKPILAVPIFADQHHNAQNGVSLGTTFLLNKAELSEESIEKGLLAILTDRSYTENASKLRKMLVERPDQPRDRFVNWMEYAAANPGLHKMFAMPGIQLGLLEYYCVDGVLLVAAIGCFALFLMWKLTKYVYSNARLTKKAKTN